MGKSSINEPFSMAMLNNQSVVYIRLSPNITIGLRPLSPQQMGPSNARTADTKRLMW